VIGGVVLLHVLTLKPAGIVLEYSALTCRCVCAGILDWTSGTGIACRDE